MIINSNKFQFNLFFIIILILPIIIIDIASADKLMVPDDLIGERTLYLVPQASGPMPCQEGQIYYGTDNQVYYCDETSNWQPIKSGSTGLDTTVGSIIVAAYDSLDSRRTTSPGQSCSIGMSCYNPKADYTCIGADDQFTITLALNYAVTRGANTVYLLEGTYNITNMISMGLSESGLIGTGSGTILNVQTDLGATPIIGSPVTTSQVLISQLAIAGNNKNVKGIELFTDENSKVESVWIKGVGSESVFLSQASKNTISGNFFIQDSISNDSVSLVTNSNQNSIIGNISTGNAGGRFVFNSSLGNVCSTNILKERDINLTSSSQNEVSGNFTPKIIFGSSDLNIVSGNSLSEDNDINITLASSSGNTLIGNSLHLNRTSGGDTRTMFLSGNNNNNSICGNSSYGNFSGDILSPVSIEVSGSCSNLISSNSIFFRDSDSEGLGKLYITCSQSTANCCNKIMGNQADIHVENAIEGDCTVTGTKIMQRETVTLDRKALDYASVVLSFGFRNTLRFGMQSAANTSLFPAPMTYIPIVASGSAVTLGTNTDPPYKYPPEDKAIQDGINVGDIIILEGTNLPSGYGTSFLVIVPNNKNTKLGASSRTLHKEDTLTLIWDGDDWVEIAYSNNQDTMN